MSWSRFRSLLRHAGFYAVLVLSSMLREMPNAAVNQAIIWLPTGVAIAGLCLLGRRAWWVVCAATITQRLLIGYDLGVALPAAAGSASEALLGTWALDRFGFSPTLNRVRHVVALTLAAMVAPIGSIFFSYVGRAWLWPDPNMPFYSGWDGWWRMNVLGALTVVPFAVVWLRIPREQVTTRLLGGALAGVIFIPIVLVATMALVPVNDIGVMTLTLVQAAVVLYVSGRWGMRGATLASALSAVTFATATTAGIGPYLEVDIEHRHVTVQLFELFFIALPPAFAALIEERRHAEARVERSDETRRAIQAALPDIIYRLRRDGTVLEVSLPPGVQSPFPLERMMGQPIVQWLAPHRVDSMRETILAAFVRGEPATLEFEIAVAGRTRMREARCVPHGPDEILAVVRDITERKWSEGTTALEAEVLGLVARGRPSAEVLAAIARGMERLIAGAKCSIITLDGRLMNVAYGASLPESYNAAVQGLEIGPEVGSCGAAASTARTVVVSDMHTSPLWKPFLHVVQPLRLRACWSVPILDSEGKVLGTFACYYEEVREPEPRELAMAERAGVLAGIALERERRAEALRRSEDLLASINRNVKEGLFRATPRMELLYFNPALARLFGYPDAAELPLSSSNGGFVSEARRLELARVIYETGEWLNEEAQFYRADGSTFWGMLSGTAVRDASGEIAWYDGAISDITERKELELQFRQSQKMEAVGKLAGGVAHDFNNLLTVIYGCAEAIRLDAADSPAIRAQAEQVLDAAGRASRLTRQLLAYSRQQIMSPRVLDLTLVVDQMSTMLRRLIGEDYRLTVEHAPGPCWVKVDPSQIEQVLLNLLVNARDAMPHGGTIALRTRRLHVSEADARAHAGARAGPSVQLSVRDQGGGMTPEVQARAFDPFFTTKPLGQGTGLGLSTVYGIVQQTGGVVWLDSAPGSGTTVWISLPEAEEPSATLEEPEPAAEGGRRGTLLVVEDESGVRALVSMTLRRAGYEVLEAGDGELGLQVAAAYAGVLDLVVTDVVMPRLGGRDMAERLLSARPGQRFLFVSGYPEDARSPLDFVGESGAFLAKPFTPAALLAAVREAIEKASATHG